MCKIMLLRHGDNKFINYKLNKRSGANQAKHDKFLIKFNKIHTAVSYFKVLKN